MRLRTVLLLLFAVLPVASVAQKAARSEWQMQVDRELPVLGHRNWILIVDSAYPLQSAPGVETIDTGAKQIDVVKYVLGAIDHSIHVRPEVFLDAELPYVEEDDAPGADAYREQLDTLLANNPPAPVLHEEMIGRVDEASRLVHVLVLKTTMTVPYSSVFLRLNCKYWSDDAETRMRAKMGPVETPAQEPQPQPSQAPASAPIQAPPATPNQTPNPEPQQ